jgi:FkbM family methyltransferase
MTLQQKPTGSSFGDGGSWQKSHCYHRWSGMRKLRALTKYIDLFENWPYAALSRYLKITNRPHIRLRFRDGRRLVFRPDSDYVALGEVFIAETYKDCRKAIDPKVVWDVGGNIGSFPIWAARYFRRARFYSFEPCRETYELLKVNRDANPKIQWETFSFGLADITKIATGFTPKGMYAETSIYAKDGLACDLLLRSTNEVWQEHGKPFIDLLKIDCEGGEYEIFEGISDEVLSNIGAIIMEYHNVEGKSVGSIQDRLADSGFRFTSPKRHQGVVWISRSEV